MAKSDHVRAYVEALGLCPVMILAGSAAAKIARAPDPKFEVFDTLWFAKLRHAELVLAHCPDGLIDGPAGPLRDIVINAAAQLGARWQTAAEVETQASNAVAEIIMRVEGMRKSGGLAKVNATYKSYRKKQTAAGKKAITYSAHLEAFTLSLIRIAAQNSGAV